MSPPLTQPYRVVLTTDAAGGVWTCTLDLAHGLAQRGVEVELVVAGPAPSTTQQKQAAAIEGLMLRMTDLPLDWTARDAGELRCSSQTFSSLCRDLRPDVVHLNNPGLATSAAVGAPLVIGLHSCVATWWQAMYGDEPLPPDLAWRAAEVRRGLRAADAIIAPSAAFAAQARAAYGEQLPIVAVSNGRRLEPVRETGPRLAVLTAGRLWDKAKNVATLDQVASSLSCPIHAAGPVREPRHEGTTATFDNIHLLGDLPGVEMGRWLARTDIFISCAYYEPFGLVVLEAAQAGCALVLSDIATFRAIWEDAAIFVDPADPSAIAAAVNCLRADSVRRQTLALAARHRARRFTPEIMVDATMNVYGSVSARVARSTGALS